MGRKKGGYIKLKIELKQDKYYILSVLEDVCILGNIFVIELYVLIQLIINQIRLRILGDRNEFY